MRAGDTRYSDTKKLAVRAILYVQICFQSHNLTHSSNNSGICIAGDLTAAVLAGVVRNTEVKSARKELTVRIATKNFAGYFLPHEGYNFTLKTSSIP